MEFLVLRVPLIITSLVLVRPILFNVFVNLLVILPFYRYRWMVGIGLILATLLSFLWIILMRFMARLMVWTSIGTIHKPRGQIFGLFWPLPPPLWTILQNKAYVVILTLANPGPLPFHVHMIYGYPHRTLFCLDCGSIWI